MFVVVCLKFYTLTDKTQTILNNYSVLPRPIFPDTLLVNNSSQTLRAAVLGRKYSTMEFLFRYAKCKIQNILKIQVKNFIHNFLHGFFLTRHKRKQITRLVSVHEDLGLVSVSQDPGSGRCS